MQVEPKSLTERFLIFILRLLINTLLLPITPLLFLPRRLFNLETLEGREALLEGTT